MNKIKTQHYIPQFMIKNFGAHRGEKVNVLNTTTGSLNQEDPHNILCMDYFYDFNVSERETRTHIIERKLGEIEREASAIIKNNIIGKDKIKLTSQESLKLVKFLLLLDFRSPFRMESYNNREAWLNDLSCFCDYEFCLGDIPKFIGEAMELYYHVLNQFFVSVVECMGEELVLTDMIGVTISYKNTPHQYVFPLFPNRAIILSHMSLSPSFNLDFNDRNELNKIDFIKFSSPRELKNGGYETTVKKIYAHEIKKINFYMLKESNIAVYKNLDKISSSLKNLIEKDPNSQYSFAVANFNFE